MQSRHAIAGAVIIALALIAWWLSRTEAADQRAQARYSDEEPSAAPSSRATAPSAVAPPTKTVRDAKLRDEMRRRIAEAWSLNASDGAAAAGGSGTNDPDAPKRADLRYAPMPERADGKIDPDYLRQRMREDFLPMARGCYDELLARDPKAAGKIVVKMTIVGDEKVGGIVDEASIDRDAGTLPDDKLETCFRESMMSMAFAPPPHGGTVTVVYPFTLADKDPDAPKEGGP